MHFVLGTGGPFALAIQDRAEPQFLVAVDKSKSPLTQPFRELIEEHLILFFVKMSTNKTTRREAEAGVDLMCVYTKDTPENRVLSSLQLLSGLVIAMERGISPTSTIPLLKSAFKDPRSQLI